MKTKGVLQVLYRRAARYTPEILTGIGIAGMVTSMILAVRATPKALDLIESKKEETRSETLTAFETVKVTWVCYIPAAISGMVSIACIIGASSANMKRNAALATAYTLSETALKEYQGKVIETIGEKKEQSIKDAIAKDKVEQHRPIASEVIITERGSTLCFDVISGRYFRSDRDKLEKAVNALNRRMRDEEYISVNEFYDEIGLPEIALGYELGWNIDKGYIDLDFSSQLAEDGTPCLVVGYHLAPKYNYH